MTETDESIVFTRDEWVAMQHELQDRYRSQMQEMLAGFAQQMAELQPTTDWRANFASSVLNGFCANSSVFQPNANTGWSLVNCKPDQLTDYAVELADHLRKSLAKEPTP